MIKKYNVPVTQAGKTLKAEIQRLFKETGNAILMLFDLSLTTLL